MDVHEREVRTRGHHAQDGRPDRVDQARVLRGTFTASASASEAPGATSSFAELGRVVAVAVLLERLEVLSVRPLDECIGARMESAPLGVGPFCAVGFDPQTACVLKMRGRARAGLAPLSYLLLSFFN